jgi:endonuclease/exonuclease/phosphatase family metal-dependent hydrolase
MSFRWSILPSLCLAWVTGASAEPVAVVSSSNVVVRIAASNLSSGNGQNYDAPGIRILQGLRPDIIAMQEFNYAGRSTADIQSLVNQITQNNGNYGTNEPAWFRETGYSIPNGIISRWPILQSGSWQDADPNINDRGFAWARIDVPGTNDLYVVSVHLKASSGSSNESRRNAQATQLKSQIATNFPANAWIIVAGDLNTYSLSEPAVITLGSFLKTSPDAVDNLGNPDTNANRNNPYDHVFASHTLVTNQVPTAIGGQSFAHGLVFDSRVYTPLADVAPVQSGDSGVSGMQHMAVVKDFRITVSVTNLVDVPAPKLTLLATNRVAWTGPSNLTYTVESSAALPAWSPLGTAASSTTNYVFTNALPAPAALLYRVRIP